MLENASLPSDRLSVSQGLDVDWVLIYEVLYSVPSSSAFFLCL